MRFPGFLALVTAAAVATGCQSDNAPVPAPAPTKSTTLESPTPESPTRSPTPTPPALPDEAKGSGRGAAKAFVLHFIDLVNYAGTTGDVAALRRAAGQGCQSCNELIHTFVKTYAAGGFYHTRGWRPVTVFVAPTGTPTKWTAATEVRTSPVRWKVSATARPTSAEADDLSLRFEIERQEQRWVISRMTRT